jgi:DNA polymerase III delta prime subunit
LDGYVFTDETQKATIEQWIKTGSIPHLILTGSPGLGKTTLAKILINALGLSDLDVLEINASHETGVENIRTNVVRFAESMSFGSKGLRIVLLDEADFLSQSAQATLRHPMEKFSKTTRFILTANAEHKILPALKSRCTHFHITRPDLSQFIERAYNILVSENIEIDDPDVFNTYALATYPDLRKCISLLQDNSKNGVLVPPSEVKGNANLELVELIKHKKIAEARKLVCSKDVGDINEVYRFIFQNLDSIFETNKQREEAILILRDAIVNHSIVADPEINLAATLVQLSGVLND